jgi:hypothetical protein
MRPAAAELDPMLERGGCTGHKSGRCPLNVRIITARDRRTSSPQVSERRQTEKSRSAMGRPLYLQQRTFLVTAGKSAWCQKEMQCNKSSPFYSMTSAARPNKQSGGHAEAPSS